MSAAKLMCQNSRKLKLRLLDWQEMLQGFFTVGGALQRSVIINIIHQVERMRDVILSLGRFRFYSSSILIVFEGDLLDFPDDDLTHDSVDHHHDHASSASATSAVDNSPSSAMAAGQRHYHHRHQQHRRRSGHHNHRRSQSAAEYDDNDFDEDDDDVVDETTAKFGEIDENDNNGSSTAAGVVKNTDKETSGGIKLTATDGKNGSVSPPTTTTTTTTSSEDFYYRKPPVVKIIDFANVTFPGFSSADPTNNSSTESYVHEGPDKGFLFGLKNLVNILNAIIQSDGH